MVQRKGVRIFIAIAALCGMYLFGQGQQPWGPQLKPVPDTGISVCYDNSHVIDCPDPGQPYYGQDAQYLLHAMSFTDNGNGTITDNVTTLMWQQEDDDLSRTWAQATDYCETLTLADYADWRLPTEVELQRIVDYGRYSPAIDTGYFSGTDAQWYWASTPKADDADSAWLIYFKDGHFYFFEKANPYYVRCVRGQSDTPAFVDNGNGTVTDNLTGLTWQKEDDNTKRNWQQALAYCEDLVWPVGGQDDWRLPDAKELISIVDHTQSYPAVNVTFFPGTDPDWYWTSSTYVHMLDNALHVNFDYGGVGAYNKASGSYVRCVR